MLQYINIRDVLWWNKGVLQLALLEPRASYLMMQILRTEVATLSPQVL